MAFLVPASRDAEARRTGPKMYVQHLETEKFLPEFNRETIADLHAGKMQLADDPFLNRALGTSNAPHKGKRVFESAAQKPNVYLFDKYGSFPPPPVKAPNTHDYSDDQLRQLMHDGSAVDRSNQQHYMEETPSLRDKELVGRPIDRFYGDPSAKAQSNQQEGLSKGLGTKKHGLLDELKRNDGIDRTGKRINKNPYDIPQVDENGLAINPYARKPNTRPLDFVPDGIVGFRGVGTTPGNKDPTAELPVKVHRTYDQYDPLHMRERGASPKKRAVDDLRPPTLPNPRKVADGKQASELMQRKPGAGEKECPRTTKMFPQYQVAVSQGPNLIDGFQSMGCCDVHTGGVLTSLPVPPVTGVKKTEPPPTTTYMQPRSFTGLSKRNVQGEPGDGRGILYDRAPSAEPWSSTGSDYGAVYTTKAATTPDPSRTPAMHGYMNSKRAQSSMLSWE